MLGVPFYARPSWADYGTILADVPDAWSRDSVLYNGMEVYYNGVGTIGKKTKYGNCLKIPMIPGKVFCRL